MVIKKTIGYVLALTGVAGVALTTFPELKTALIPQLAGISDSIILILSAAFILIGILLITKTKSSSKKKNKELPIFEGEDVVGYRRNKK